MLIWAFYFLDSEIFYLLCVVNIVLQQGLFDFWSTQFKIKSLAKLRIYFLLLTVLIIFTVDNLFYLVFARQIFFIACTLIFDYSAVSQKLKLKNPHSYIIGTHCIYFGHLILISLLIDKDLAKYIFITVQIAHQVVLKVIDFSIRAAYSIKIPIKMLIFRFACLIFLLLPISFIYLNLAFNIVLTSLCCAMMLYVPVVKYSIND